MMTPKKRGLVVLIGGRQVPNVLTAQHLQPDIIVPIASHEALLPHKEWAHVKPVLQQLCPQGLHEPWAVSAFDPAQIEQACLDACDLAPDAEWFFNITCGTTLMSLGAARAGEKRGAAVWYLDSAGRQVITLHGPTPQADLYRVTVENYLAIYGRRAEAVPDDPSENMLDLARMLAREPHELAGLKRKLSKAQAGKGKTIELPPFAFGKRFLLAAQKAGLVDAYQPLGYGLRFTVRDAGLMKFVNGDWLEIYAWGAAREARCFDHYRYGVRMPGDFATNEIDLAATCAAAVVLAECKTEENPFAAKLGYLDKLNSIANMLGGNYVTRLFIASQQPMLGNQDEYDAFCKQAQERQIVVVTGEQLKDLPQILRREAGAEFPRQRPTYTRI